MHEEDTTPPRTTPSPAAVIGRGLLETRRVGALELAWSESGIVHLWFVDGGASDADDLVEVPERYAAPLRRYFAGEPVDPATLPVDYAGQGTPKQRKVWDALRTIPRGEVRSYAWLARQVRSVPRAVGQANARNPIAIVVPCHRVVDSNDALGGYTGGLHRKTALLELEGLTVHGGRVARGQLSLG